MEEGIEMGSKKKIIIPPADSYLKEKNTGWMVYERTSQLVVNSATIPGSEAWTKRDLRKFLKSKPSIDAIFKRAGKSKFEWERKILKWLLKRKLK